MILALVHWLAFAYLLTKFLIKVFLGDLRAIEVENVQGNFWLSLVDIALTLTIFHRETESAPVSIIMLLRAFHLQIVESKISGICWSHLLGYLDLEQALSHAVLSPSKPFTGSTTTASISWKPPQ